MTRETSIRCRKPQTFSLCSQTAPRIKFPDQSRLNQRSQQEPFALEQRAVLLQTYWLSQSNIVSELDEAGWVSWFLEKKCFNGFSKYCVS